VIRVAIGARALFDPKADPQASCRECVLDLEIAPVGHDRNPLHAENLFCRFGGLCQETHIDDLVRDLLLDDQLVLGIDGDLHVVAHRNVRMPRHRTKGPSPGPLCCREEPVVEQHGLAEQRLGAPARPARRRR
jgi:hypothetical protein